ncbi:hypothetical protein PQQ87_08645 [Paraburkholderia nemoris]|uniref:DUF6651 domain-containing protein n=1 Tax=Paraburkholderia nemoris TaxID=2793076 RepID=UPI0038B8D09F
MSWLLKQMMGQARLMDAAGEGGDPGGGAGGGAEGAGGGDGGAGGGDGKTKPGGEGGQGGQGDPTKRTPSDEEARLLKENMKKKDQIEKLSKDLEGAKAVLGQLEELGGLDAIKALVQKQKDDETRALEAKGEWERLKERMAGEHKAATKALEDQIAALRGELDASKNQIVELSIGTQFSQSQFIAQELTLTPSKARVVYGDYFDVQDGKVIGYDKPRGAANRTAIVDASGEPVAFEAALKKIVEADPDRDHLIKAKIKPGAGSDNRAPASAARQAVAARQEQNKTGVSRIAAGLGKLGKIA